GGALVASLRPSILDCDGATIDPAELAQPLDKGGVPVPLGRRCARTQDSDGRHLFSLLPTRRERPRSSCAAEQRDELAALHHSITSSASSNTCVPARKAYSL